jgi:hypothetical protein
MKLEQQLLHSVNGSGKIKLSKEVMDEVGLIPGRRIEIIVEKGLIKISPVNKSF